MNADRIELLADDVYQLVFEMLDAEFDLDGLEAGRIATATQKAFTAAANTDATKCLSYCYPSSPDAERHGFGTVGCWVVSYPSGDEQPFADEEDAKHEFLAIDAVASRYCLSRCGDLA